MSADNNKEFPFELKKLSPQEAASMAGIFPDEAHTSDTVYRAGKKGFIINEGTKDSIVSMLKLEIQPTDIFVVAHPRSGTNWTQEIVWMLANDLDYEKSSTVPMTERFLIIEATSFINHHVKNKLLEKHREHRHYQDIVERVTRTPKERIEELPSPRFMKTHLPLSLMPPAMLETAKVVYVARDPRDVAVSQYHLYKQFTDVPSDFKTFWNAYMNDMVYYTPYFEHVTEAWEQRQHPNMLFLFYEELYTDISRTVQRIAQFLGKKIEEPALTWFCEHLSIDNFRKSITFIPAIYEKIGLIKEPEKFIRKGKAGGWRDYFDAEMTEDSERWIADNLRNTDLRFPVVNNK